MSKESFMLVSLKEDKAKKLAQVITNDSCRKILGYLSEHEFASESDLAKELKIPISTAHYNLSMLEETGLITAEEFHYSKKGKEVNHYKLANKYIIIAPKSTYGIKERIRSILPVALAGIAIAGLIQAYQSFFFERQTLVAPLLSSAPEVAVKSVVQDAAISGAGAGAAEATKNFTTAAASELAGNATTLTTLNHQTSYAIAGWFLIGFIAAVILYLVFTHIRDQKT